MSSAHLAATMPGKTISRHKRRDSICSVADKTWADRKWSELQSIYARWLGHNARRGVPYLTTFEQRNLETS
jgi:hypothetical protein